MSNKALAWPLLAGLALLALHGAIAARHSSAAGFQKYQLAANQYCEGKLDNERLADFSPLYFHLHVALQRWPAHPEKILLWLQVLLVAMSAGLLLDLLRRHFPLPIALVGITAFALDRSILVYERIYEPEILLLFFLLAAWHCCDRAGSAWRTALGGTFFALALLCRLNYLPLAALVPTYFYVQRKGSTDWIRFSASFLLPPLLCLGFLSTRNLRIQGIFTPVSMNPGTVFFEGNNPNSHGQSSIYPPLVYDLADEYPDDPDPQHMLYRLVARNDSGSKLDIPAVNRYWRGKAMHFIHDHPWHFLKRLADKAYFFFHDFRRHDISVAFRYDQALARANIPTVPFAAIAALAIIGMSLSVRDWRRSLLAYGLLLTQLAVLLLTYVSSRQRVAVLPAFMFFACAAAAKIVPLARHSRRGLAVAAVVILTLLLLAKNDAMREEEHQWRNFLRSRELYRAALRQRGGGRWASASQSARMALATAPWLGDSLRPADLCFAPQGFHRGALAMHKKLADPDFSTRFDRAFLALAVGELEEARAIYSSLVSQRRRFKRDFDQSSQPRFYLAKIALKRNDRPAAIALLAMAAKEAPGDPEILALSYALTGDPTFHDRIERYFGGLDRDFFVGRAFLEIGEARRALPFLSRLAQALPHYRRGLIYLAAALAGSGSEQEGASVFLSAIGRRTDPLFLEAEILNAFRRWRDREPGNARGHFFYAQALRQYGHYPSARAELLEARRLSPGHPLVDRELQNLELIMTDYSLK